METIQDDCSGLGKLSAEKAKQEKPQENTCFLELSSVGLTGFEPATSTPPELLHDSAKSRMSVFSVANLTGNASWH